MFNTIINIYNNFEEKTNTILKIGLLICSLICFSSLIILCTYIILNFLNLYYIGLALFKISIIFGIEFIVCSFVIDGIKKQLI